MKNYLLRRAIVQWMVLWTVQRQCRGGAGVGDGRGFRRTKHKRHSISLAIFAFVGTPFFFTPCACFTVQHLFIYPRSAPMLRLLCSMNGTLLLADFSCDFVTVCEVFLFIYRISMFSIFYRVVRVHNSYVWRGKSMSTTTKNRIQLDCLHDHRQAKIQ